MQLKQKEITPIRRHECSAHIIIQVEQVSIVLPDGAQGGMLKYEFADSVYGNCIVSEVCFNHIPCGSVEDYMGYEQHRSNVLSQTMEYMKC